MLGGQASEAGSAGEGGGDVARSFASHHHRFTITCLGTSHTKTHDTVLISTVYGDQIDLTAHRLTVVLTAMYEVTRLRRRCSRGRKGAAVGVMYVCMAGGVTGIAKGVREREGDALHKSSERARKRQTNTRTHPSLTQNRSKQATKVRRPPLNTVRSTALLSI